MSIGAHMSIAGGVANALIRGKKVGCEVIQIFTKNASQWKSIEIKEAEINEFKKNKQITGISSVFAHNAYLINLASPNKELHKKSLNAMLIEMQRGEALGLDYIIMHPGTHMGLGEKQGLKRVADSLKTIFEETPEFKIRILLETTAGQGSALGYRFEHIVEIIDLLGGKYWTGVCFDTAHVFASGYDIKNKYDEVFNEFDRIVGLERLKVFHFNDTLKEMGSRVDRHWHIGKGKIGKETFRKILNDERFKDLPMIIEIPKGVDKNGKDLDILNIKFLKRLREDL